MERVDPLGLEPYSNEEWEEDIEDEDEEEEASQPEPVPEEPLKPPFDESGRDYRLVWLKRQLCLYLNLLDPDVAEEHVSNPPVAANFIEFLDNDLVPMNTDQSEKLRTAYFFKMKVLAEAMPLDTKQQAVVEVQEFDETTDTEKKGKKGKKGKGKGKGKKGKGGGKPKGGEKKDKSSASIKTTSKSKSKSAVGSKKGKGKKDKKKKTKQKDKTVEEPTTPIVYPWDEDTDQDVESLPEDTNRYYLDFFPYKLPNITGRKNAPGLFFIRMSRVPVPQMRSLKEAELEMPKHLMFGSMQGFQLRPIIQIFKALYHPLIELSDLDGARRRFSQTKLDVNPLSDSQKNQLKGELEFEIRKFVGALNRAVENLESEIKITIPSIPELQAGPAKLKQLSKNKAFVTTLETISQDLEQRISDILEKELPTQPRQFTPLSELEFWRDRNAILSAVFDQLQSKEVQHLSQVLSLANSDVLPGFEYQQGELLRSSQEARDVSRFLSTIERHL